MKAVIRQPRLVVDGVFTALFFNRVGGTGNQTTSYHARKTSEGYYLFGFTGQIKPSAVGKRALGQQDFMLVLKTKLSSKIAPHLNLTVDYGFQQIAIPLFKALTFFHDIVGNWGLAIILLTLLVKAVRFSAKGYRSMANMRRVAPAMKRLQERYATIEETVKRNDGPVSKGRRESAGQLFAHVAADASIFGSLLGITRTVELRQAPFIFGLMT